MPDSACCALQGIHPRVRGAVFCFGVGLVIEMKTVSFDVLLVRVGLGWWF